MRTVKNFLRLSVAAGACAVAMTAAWAAEPERGARAACATDLATFCAGTEAGGGKKMRCLADNQNKLSPGCATSLQARMANRAARLGGTDLAQAQTAPQAAPQAQSPAQPQTIAPPVAPARPAAASPIRGNMRACRTDMATLCASVEKGGGGKIKCLADNQAKLSPDCAAAVTNVQSQRQAAKGACEADAATLCAGAKGPARMQCLEANKAKLSPACGQRLEKRAANQANRAAVQPPTSPKQ